MAKAIAVEQGALREQLREAETERIVVAWFYSATFWLVLGMSAGVLTAIKFVFPDFWGHISYLTMGRARPVHVNAVAFGFLSQAQVGAALYIIPRLVRRPFYSPALARYALWVWNLALIIGIGGLFLGYTEGREYAELIAPADWLLVAALGMLVVGFLFTIALRREKQLYVSVWYIVGSLLWMPIVFMVGNHTFLHLTGLNDAIANWFYGHNILGLWFTTMGVGGAYYLLPILARQPLWSHRLSLVGFWALAIFYAPIGAHHILQAPIPEYLKTISVFFSGMLMLPVLTVLTNFYMTLNGRWRLIVDDMPTRFLVAGAVHYLVTCIQGPMQAARWLNPYIHFTNWVVAHAHMALLGTFAFWLWAAAYYILPRILKREWPSRGMIGAHFWLSFLGFFIFFAALMVAGLEQSMGWWMGEPVQKIILYLRPMFFLRLLGGTMLLLGNIIFAYHMWLMARQPATAGIAPTDGAAAAPAGA